MDSMRSLNTSLPRSTPRRQPPEQLLQAFKAAALSVTNLYKDAVCEEAQARHAGYQEAIEDLLNFLDKENLGLGDGEGWRIRQWATERADGTAAAVSDDDDRDFDKPTRSTSPVAQRKEQPQQQQELSQPQHPPGPAPERRSSPSSSSSRDEPTDLQQHPASMSSQATDSNTFNRPAVFTFTAGQSLPHMQQDDIDMRSSDDIVVSSQEDTVSVSVLPRNARSQYRHTNHSRPSSCVSTRDLSGGLGTKRKLTFPDFFDLSGVSNGRDFFGGGKRGRFA